MTHPVRIVEVVVFQPRVQPHSVHYVFEMIYETRRHVGVVLRTAGTLERTVSIRMGVAPNTIPEDFHTAEECRSPSCTSFPRVCVELQQLFSNGKEVGLLKDLCLPIH